MSDYTNIERPYGPFLERESDTLVPETDNTSLQTNAAEDSINTQTNLSAGGSGGGSDKVTVPGGQAFGPLTEIDGIIRSKNWKPQKQGFSINGETGYAEFSNVRIFGPIVAETGTIGGWDILPSELIKGNVRLQSDAERILMGSATAPLTGTGIFLGKDGSDYKFRVGNPAGPYMHWDGSVLSVTGVNIISPGTGTDLASLTWSFDAVFSKTATTVDWTTGTLIFSNGLSYSITPAGSTSTITDTTRVFIYFDKDVSTSALQTSLLQSDAVGPNKVLIAVARKEVASEPTYQVFGGGGGVGLNVDATVPVSANGWMFDGVFSSSNEAVVAWGAGTLSLGDGDATTYAISAGNTGTMSAVTYIYFDSSSPTILQITTTPATAVGENKILIAVAQNVASPKKATFQVFGGRGGVSNLITADQIAANTITGNEIASNTITAGKIFVTSLSTINADIGSITSGTITGALIRTSSSGSRVEIDGGSDDIQIFDSGNDLRMKLDSNELAFHNTFGKKLGYINTPTSTNFGISSTNGNFLVINSEGTLYGVITQVNGSNRFFVSNTQVVCYVPYNMNGQKINTVDTVRFVGKNITPGSLAAGELGYHDSGGVQGFRVRAGIFDGQIDLTAFF